MTQRLERRGIAQRADKVDPRPPVGPYDANRTYLALVVGDGDSVSKLKTNRFAWMQQRVAMCRANASACFPLVWSFSPMLVRHVAPVARWYWAQAAATGRDYFSLPPSGHTYAYPGIMPPATQAEFVAATEADARLLSTDATVDWEWFSTWHRAFEFFPQYARNGVIRGIFPVNVPYMFPVPQFLDGEFIKVLNGTTVVFRPREWRGTSGHASNIFVRRDYLPVPEMAAEVNAAVGAVEPALEWVERAASSVLLDLVWLDRCPALDALRVEPRFQAARARVRARCHELWRG